MKFSQVPIGHAFADAYGTKFMKIGVLDVGMTLVDTAIQIDPIGPVKQFSYNLDVTYLGAMVVQPPTQSEN